MSGALTPEVATGLLMAVSVAGAIVAVGVRNILHAIFGLAIALLGVAGLFLVLGSPFVAAMEVIIYVGGISVAMIFAVMLSTVVAGESASGSRRRRLIAAAVSLLVFAALAGVIVGADFGAPAHVPDEAWAVERLGEALLDRFNVVFETLSVILLLAIIGAIVISRRERTTP